MIPSYFNWNITKQKFCKVYILCNFGKTMLFCVNLKIAINSFICLTVDIIPVRLVLNAMYCLSLYRAQRRAKCAMFPVVISFLCSAFKRNHKRKFILKPYKRLQLTNADWSRRNYLVRFQREKTTQLKRTKVTQ